MRARKQVAIFNEPNVLTVHLKRFNSSPFSSGGKIGRHVRFSPQLDLQPFSSRSLQLERPAAGSGAGCPSAAARCERRIPHLSSCCHHGLQMHHTYCRFNPAILPLLPPPSPLLVPVATLPADGGVPMCIKHPGCA